MNKRSRIHKKADSSASSPVFSQLQSRPFIAQAKPESHKPLPQTDIENREFEQHNFDATRLKLQAKHGTITPEGQEQLTVLQAKMSGLLGKKLEQASPFGQSFANISISRPDAPPDAPLQQAIQTKLMIGEPGDKYEREADLVASQVVKQINTPALQQVYQRQPIQREEVAEEEDKLQMKPVLQLRSAKVGMSAAPDVEASIKQAQGGGQPLPKSIRKPMEQSIGADFSRVKVHTDSRSDQLNQSIQAKAFTTGQDVFFRQGEYNPGSRGGQELLAHELTHVVQQKGGAVQRMEETNQRETSKLKMGEGKAVDLRTNILYSDDFSSCSPVVMFNTTTKKGALFHFPAQDIANQKGILESLYKQVNPDKIYLNRRVSEIMPNFKIDNTKDIGDLLEYFVEELKFPKTSFAPIRTVSNEYSVTLGEDENISITPD